jgi:transposase
MNSRPIAQVAREIGVNEGTLGNWVATYRRDHADEEPALELTERARLREAERLVRELKKENEGEPDRGRVGSPAFFGPVFYVISSSALLTFLWVLLHDRPGSGGQRPPRVRSAMAISASGLW